MIDSLQTIERGQPLQTSDELIRIRNIGTVSRGYADPPGTLMRFNGQPGIVLALAPLAGVNAVVMGGAVNQRLSELKDTLPVGIDVHEITWQSPEQPSAE